MRTDSSRGTFAEIIRDSTPEMAAIMCRLHDLITDIYPDVIQVPKPAEHHVEYRLGQDKAAEIFGYLCPLKDYVRLGFYYGAALPDPNKLLIGEGKRLRHIKIYSLAEANRSQVRQLLRAAVRERKKALNR